MAFMNVPREEGGIAGIQMPVIADFNKQIARQYGLLLEDGLPLRGMFIIDTSGVLRHITVNDIPVGRSVDETLRLIRAHQLIESSNGELCVPVNWRPGDTAIKFHPVLYKEVG